jgi:hypothetical protein
MKDYLLLQGLRLHRMAAQAGLPLWAAYPLAALALLLLALWANTQPEVGPYAVLLLALGLLGRLSGRPRADFLRLAFGDRRAQRVRLAENLLACLPFLAVLLACGAYWPAAALALLAPALSLARLGAPAAFVVPTPFRRHPYEFIVGFRTTFYVFPVAYTLAGISWAVGHLNLGLFALAAVCLTALGYYGRPEPELDVWVHALGPRAFLLRKLRLAVRNLALLCLPVLLPLALGFPESLRLLLAVFGLGLGFLLLFVLAKYAAYPREMSLPEGLLLAGCFLLPPLLLGIGPLFYVKSIRNLQSILHDPT